MDLNIGRKLDGRYEITELIGIGGMAHVYKAVDLMEDKVVAVKILKSEFAESEEFLRRFRNESKAIAVLSHPNIVKIFDVGFTDEVNFIVMEYIDGITLKEFMEQQGVLRWKDAMFFITQVLRALQHAHDRGIVHRDIKPQNIMLFSDGTIKVMDFGIARFSRIDGKTLSDKTIGSVHYISPEQARGDFTDERSDLYSVGVMLYEMLTGKKPFDGDNPVAVALMHMQETPAAPRDINSSVPEAIEEIIIHAMEREPSRRYQSASEMIKDLDMFKIDQSVVFGYKNTALSGNDEDETTKFFKPVTAPISHPADNRDDENEDYDDDEDEEQEEEKRSYVIPILAAVSVAVVIIAAIIIAVIVGKFNSDAQGDNRVQVPKFVGESISDIREEYGDIFTFKTTEEYSSQYEEGYVIKQGTSEGASVEKGTTISLTVSRGPRMTYVPTVTNWDYSDAETELKKYGFTVTKITKPDDNVKEGLVISTDPAPGEEAPEGSAITVFVSSGPLVNQVQMPKLIGETEENAKKLLEEAGLVCGEVKEVNQLEDKDKVVSQSVAEGKYVEKGTAIVIGISTGVEAEASVELSVPIPEGANGKFKLDVYDENGTIVVSSTIDKAEVIAGGTKSVSVSGKGSQSYTVYVSNITTGSSDVKYATYTVDFNSKKATENSVDKEAFLSIVDATIEVPYFVNMTYTEAVSQYGDKFNILKVEEYSSSYAAGYVVKQNVNNGSKVSKGTTITLTVSLGAEPVVTTPAPVVTTPPPASEAPDVTDSPAVSDEPSTSDEPTEPSSEG